MNRRILTEPEVRQMKAIIHALEKGRQDCTSEEKRLVNRYVLNMKIRIAENEEAKDEEYFRALEKFAEEKRCNNAQSRN